MRPVNLLLVDDNPSNLEILLEIFGEGFDTRTAASGEEALFVLQSYRPDIVLLDIMMPGIDGYEVCRRIRATRGLTGLKVIMVSAKALLQERILAYEAGADDYVAKPFDDDEILSKVRVFARLKNVEELVQIKTDILTLITDALQTPLRWITTPAEALSKEGDIPEEQLQRLAKVIANNAARLSEFFRKATMLCELREGRIGGSLAEVDLCSLLRAVVEEQRALIEDRCLTVMQDLRARPVLRADQEKLRIAFSHVLQNSLEFSQSGAIVTIGVGESGSEAVVTFEDSGKGIGPSLLPHVFTEFAASELKNYSDGPGLSLAIAREIALLHGGDLAAESLPGLRTVFTFSLPVPSGAERTQDRPRYEFVR